MQKSRGQYKIDNFDDVSQKVISEFGYNFSNCMQAKNYVKIWNLSNIVDNAMDFSNKIRHLLWVQNVILLFSEIKTMRNGFSDCSTIEVDFDEFVLVLILLKDFISEERGK